MPTGFAKGFIRSRYPAFANLLRLNLRYAKQFCGVPPESFERGAAIWQCLFEEYGYGRSCQTNSSVDALGEPIPWYSYPATEFLSGISFAGKKVWEYGCGNSTLWWAIRAQLVRAVESEVDWHTLVKKKLPGNASVDLAPDRRAYIDAIRADEFRFDVIVVDGLVTDLYRFECCVAAVDALEPGGMIILDNSDWLPRSCGWLVENGFTQIDFNGFSPINRCPGRTSVFFRDRMGFGRLPHRPTVGGIVRNWELDPANPA
ncbi:MAG: hypothetical protein ABSB15_22445 [Bryobacteraceae bacterium]|jgi:hypothetical protein